MSVTERVMSVGQWSLDLHPDTPSSIMRAIHPDRAAFRQVVLTDVPVDPAAMTDAGMLTAARWAGIYRTLEGHRMSGPGLAWLLGDEGGKGNVFELPVSLAGETLPGAMRALNTWTGLDVTGQIMETPGRTVTDTFRWVTARQAITDICRFFGAEWRVKPDMKISAGDVSFLYGETPGLIVLADDEGGRAQWLTGVRGTAARSVDADDYANKLIYLTQREEPARLNEDGTVADPAKPADWVVATRPDTWRDPMGRQLLIDKLVEARLEDGDRISLAAAELGKAVMRREWRIDTPATDVTRVAPVGSWVYVWAPDAGLVDTTRHVIFQGRDLHPSRDRLMGATWPIRHGMGAYLRYRASETATPEWLDLSAYYLPESGGTTLEIGATPRPSY